MSISLIPGQGIKILYMPRGMAKKEKKILLQPEDEDRPGTPPSSPDLSGVHPGWLLRVSLRGLAFGETKIPITSKALGCGLNL